MSRPAAQIQHADKGITYHVAQVVSCQRANCAHCADHVASEAYLMDVQREAVDRQNERRAAMEERW